MMIIIIKKRIKKRLINNKFFVFQIINVIKKKQKITFVSTYSKTKAMLNNSFSQFFLN